jgi:CubicO group peptidase (beta-lactamase class C family)
MGVLQLVEQGKVQLEAPVRRYLPYFQLKDTRAADITVQQLLNHTSGLPDVTNHQWEHPEYDVGALERYVRGWADSMLVAAPGERFHYSNIGFEVAADLIAKVSGEVFEDFMQQHILTPVGMGHSTFMMSDIDSAHMALPHVRNNQGVIRQLDYYPYHRAHAGSGTLHSNVDDMLRWAEANLRGGELDGNRVAGAATVQRLWASTVDQTEEARIQAYLWGPPTPFEGTGYSLGWRWYRMNGHQLVGHGGQDDGFRVNILLAPDDSIGVVVLANDYAGGPRGPGSHTLPRGARFSSTVVVSNRLGDIRGWCPRLQPRLGLFCRQAALYRIRAPARSSMTLMVSTWSAPGSSRARAASRARLTAA